MVLTKLRLEADVRSLLASCEELSNNENNFPRLKKFIKSLDTMIEELAERPEELRLGTISEYKNKLSTFKKITNYVEESPTSKGSPKQNNGELLKEMNHLKASQQYSLLRKELIGDDSNLRKRNPQTNTNMDQAMKYYSTIQEKVTEDMLALTRSLKEQTLTANKIIKHDTEVVIKSTQMSDKNLNSLTKEAEKLQDHSHKACKCWLWMMIALVMIIFIFMVLFMKVMKKKT